jgi:hypothetical protein
MVKYTKYEKQATTFMKNDFCDLPQEAIHELPERFKGFLLSPFQHNVKNGFVLVPADAFKEMIDIIAEYAQQRPQPGISTQDPQT